MAKKLYLCTELTQFIEMISKNQIKFVHQLEQKKYRKQEGLFIAEGHKVVGDLIKSGFVPKQIFATSEWIDKNNYPNVIEVTNDELTRLSLQQHPQQVIGIFQIPEESQNPDLQLSSINPSTSSLSLFLDNVQDPGNLGTIIRIADWFGIDTIYCSEGTVDAWNPKVVQATMGSIARVHIIYIDPNKLFNILPEDYPIYGTFLDGENIYTQQLSQYGIIVMGNEGNGISDAVRARVTHKLLIPDFHQGDTADSLNVAIATAITCSEFRRRL
jgi:TrmH family RNA methyltransferase